MPIFLQVFMTLRDISPLLAISIRSNVFGYVFVENGLRANKLLNITNFDILLFNDRLEIKYVDILIKCD